jgi:hypothetical protein
MTEGLAALSERVFALKERVGEVSKDLEKACGRIDALEKQQRWLLGAATGMGAMIPIALPKLAEILGIG